MGEIALDNRDVVAFEATAEIVTRLGNVVNVAVRSALLQLYKERDRIVNMGAAGADDRLPDAGDTAGGAAARADTLSEIG
jgi:hypothetical protein